MPIRVTCSACGSGINAPDKAAGKTGKCPKCGQTVSIPAPASQPLPPAPKSTAKPSELKPPSPNKPTPAPTPAPPTDSYDVEVEKDDDFDVEVEAEAFDVEVEAEDDYDVEVDAPKHPPQPIQQAPPTQAEIPLPPVLVGPATVEANPFDAIGPLVESPARKLSSRSDDDDQPTEAARESVVAEFSLKWKIVRAGLNQLQIAAYISIVSVIFFMIGSSLLTLRTKLDILVLTPLGLGLVIALVSIVFLLMGLNKCMSGPTPREGGPSPQFAQFAFSAVLAAVLLAVCGIGIIAALAVPFFIGFFLRAVGESLPSPAMTAAATRYLIAVGLSLAVGLLLALVPVVASMVATSKMGVNYLTALALGANTCSAFVQIAALLVAVLAYSTAAREIQRRLQPKQAD